MEYVLFDVDKIKEYVFDSFKPKEVAGASELIKCLDFDPAENEPQHGQLFLELAKKFPDITPLYARGGGGLLAVPDGRGEEICAWLETHYPQHALNGSLTAVCHPKTGDFQRIFSILNYELRRQKSEKWLTQPLAHVRFTKDNPRCGACGKRPAKEIKEYGDEKIPYCEVCLHKRGVMDNGEDQSKQAAESLEDIVLKAPGHIKETKHLLVIYGDLNEAGTHLSRFAGEEDLKEFSRNVFETINSTRQEIELDLKASGFLPLMPVVGGDDMIIFTHPASFDLIKDRLFDIEEALTKKTGRKVRMNFSFMVAKHNFPIYHLFKISEDLLQKTKDRYYRQQDRLDSYYGFFWLWEGEYRPSDQDVYLKSDFRVLFDLAGELHQQPNIHRSALYQLLELIPSQPSEVEREMNVDYFLARRREFGSLISKTDSRYYIHAGKGERIKLTRMVLEDIINMQDLLFEKEKPEEEAG